MVVDMDVSERTEERTWTPDEAARAEVLRLYNESCAKKEPLRGAEIARRLPGLKARWVQQLIAKERKARRAEAKTAKADAKRAVAANADAPTLPLAEEPAKPKRAHAQSAPAVTATASAQRGGGAVVAWGVFVLGLFVSIASNIGHVLIVVQPEAGLVRLGSMGMAALWPVLLAAAVEVVSRVAWPRSWRWRVPGYAGTIIVGLIAFAISYQHLHGLLLAFGESGLTALLGPLALDLTIVVAGVALLAIGESRKAGAAAA
jgi:hypothetical protein